MPDTTRGNTRWMAMRMSDSVYGDALGASRPCYRSVTAHRIVGGGLGRRYDHAARLSDYTFSGSDQYNNHGVVDFAQSTRGPSPSSGDSPSQGDDQEILADPPPLDPRQDAGHGARRDQHHRPARFGRAGPLDGQMVQQPEQLNVVVGDLIGALGGAEPERPVHDEFQERENQQQVEEEQFEFPDEAGVEEVMGGVARALGGESGRRFDDEDSLNDARDVSTTLLSTLCIEAITSAWDSHSVYYLPKVYHIPHELCARLLRLLVLSRKLTASSLSGFFNPGALELDLTACSYVPKSVFKQLGYSCPRLIHLNLSMCTQVNNAVVRSILQGCSALRQLYLDGCRHVTDAGFHLQQSPFYVLVGAVSLETISVQGCPQVTGALVVHLQKVCRNLKELGLARCKNVDSLSVRRVFESCPALESLNLSFLEVQTAFEGLVKASPGSTAGGEDVETQQGEVPLNGDVVEDRVVLSRGSAALPVVYPPVWAAPCALPALRHLNLGGCAGVSDRVLAKVARAFPLLEGVHLEHCLAITDAGVRSLAAGCRGMRALGLCNCGQITDDTLETLSVYCAALEWVDFSWCSHLTDKGVKHLAEGCPMLEEVRAVCCEGVTDASLLSLSRCCKHLEALRVRLCRGITPGVVSALREGGVEVLQ